MNNSIKFLKVVTGVGLLLTVIAFGYFLRSPWVILPLGFIFTVSFVLGRWQSWKFASSRGGLFGAIKNQWKTFLIQVVVCGIFYLIGRGLNTVFNDEYQATVFNQLDIWALLALAVFAVIGGLFIIALERKVKRKEAIKQILESMDDDENKTNEESGFRVLFDPVTLENFFEGHSIKNKDHLYDDDKETVVNPDRAFVSEAQISEAEENLGICLPEMLRALYLIQNGGYTGALVTPLKETPSPREFDDWLMPFGGYDDLHTVTSLETVYETVTNYAELEELESFPIGCKRMIVLAQWYRHTLFLDYRNIDKNGGEPRVGFVDFDDYEDLQESTWEGEAHWWDDFDSFFAQLRRSEDL